MQNKECASIARILEYKEKQRRKRKDKSKRLPFVWTAIAKLELWQLALCSKGNRYQFYAGEETDAKLKESGLPFHLRPELNEF